jgi:hypothetical protein
MRRARKAALATPNKRRLFDVTALHPRISIFNAASAQHTAVPSIQKSILGIFVASQSWPGREVEHRARARSGLLEAIQTGPKNRPKSSRARATARQNAKPRAGTHVVIQTHVKVAPS